MRWPDDVGQPGNIRLACGSSWAPSSDSIPHTLIPSLETIRACRVSSCSWIGSPFPRLDMTGTSLSKWPIAGAQSRYNILMARAAERVVGGRRESWNCWESEYVCFRRLFSQESLPGAHLRPMRRLIAMRGASFAVGGGLNPKH